MPNIVNRIVVCAAILMPAALALTGCDRSQDKPRPPEPAKVGSTVGDEVAAERAKLSPNDRALVEAQEWCVVQTDERLGSMGPPLQLDIKGQRVFVCCKGCKRKAEADPDRTLAKVEQLKARAKSERYAKK